MLTTLVSADSVNVIAITGTANDGYATSSGDYIIKGLGLSLMQSSAGGPSSIDTCNMGSLCDFTFHSTDSANFCSYCAFYAYGTFGTKVAEYFVGTLTFSGSAVWTGQSTLNVPLSISGIVAGFELLNCDQGASCTLGPQVFDLKIVGQGTGQFNIAETGLVMGVNANFTGTATNISTVPEPFSLLLMSSGLAGIALAKKRSFKEQNRSA
jgi:hypothetical protein